MSEHTPSGPPNTLRVPENVVGRRSSNPTSDMARAVQAIKAGSRNPGHVTIPKS